MCTLRTEILRTVNRPRTAPTVRLSLSAIIVGLFPASTISRNCLSSSGSQRRRRLRALIPPAVSPGVVSFDQAHGRFRAYRVRLADVPRFASRRVVPARYIPQGCAWRPQWRVSVSPGRDFSYPGTQLTRTGNQARSGRFVPSQRSEARRAFDSLSQSKSGLISAPLAPQTSQTNSGSRSDSRT